jgi:hypothetical protein
MNPDVIAFKNDYLHIQGLWNKQKSKKQNLFKEEYLS